MWRKMKPNEKRIFAAAIFCSFFFAFLLANDFWLDWDSGTDKLRKVGLIIEKSNDVRQKYSKQYLWKSARVSSSIHQGDSIFTGAGSESRVELMDGSQIVVRENSLIVFNLSEKELNMNFSFGKIFGFTGSSRLKLNDCGQTYEISGAKGQYEIDKSEGCGGVKLKVLSGQVSVNGLSFTKNQSALLEPGKKPKLVTATPAAKSKRLPSSFENGFVQSEIPRFVSPQANYTHFIDLDEDGHSLNAKNFMLQWSYPREKLNFELAVSAEPEFKQVYGPFRVNSLKSATPILPNGNYFARVRAWSTDRATHSPWSAVLPFQIKNKKFLAKLEAPKLVTKSLNYRAPASDLPQFSWTTVPGADHYVFELSRDPDFKDSVFLDQAKASYRWSRFSKGRFYYRAYAATRKGSRSPASDIGFAKINFDRPLLEPVPPRLIEAKTEDEAMAPQDFKVKWQAPPADSYLIQISKDDQFKKPIQIKSRSPASTLTIEQPGEYKWRVQPLNENGKALTPFSDAGHITYNFRVPLVTPRLLEPDADMTLFFQKSDSRIFWMEWKSVRQADKYFLQIARDKNFEKVVVATETKSNRFLVEQKLPQGNLFWRVKAQGNNKESNWSPARRMSVFAGKTASLNEN